MELSVSVGITCLLMILCALSDYFLGTRYMGNTYFQPFPHLLIFGFCFLDLVLWYKKRKKKRKKVYLHKKGISLIMFYFGLFSCIPFQLYI